jgi:hypothetical protein
VGQPIEGIGSLDKNFVTLDDDQVSLSITSTTIGTYVTTVTATSDDHMYYASFSLSTRVVTPASAEIVQIDSNGSAIFRSEVIRNVIPKIQFVRGSFGYVTVNMLLNSTTLGFSIMEIEVPEYLKSSPAIITFQVEKKWLENRGVKKENIELYREDYLDWVGLGAQWTVTEGDYEQYEAVTSRFSVFKIDIEDAMVSRSLQQSFEYALFIVSISSIIAGLAGIIAYWYVRRRRK